MKVVIAGAGVVGYALAEELAVEVDEVVVIEKDTVSSVCRISKYTFISGIIILTIPLLCSNAGSFDSIIGGYNDIIKLLSLSM